MPVRMTLILIDQVLDDMRHLHDPFAGKSHHLHFAERSTTFGWDKLWETAETPR